MKEKSNLIEEKKRENIRKTYQTKVRFLTIDTLLNNSGSDPESIKRSEMYWKSLYSDPDFIREKSNFVKKKLENAKELVLSDEHNGYIKVNLKDKNNIAVKNGYATKNSTDTEIPGGLVIALMKNANIEGEFYADYLYLFDEEFKDVYIKISKNKIEKIKAQVDNEKIKNIFEIAEGDKDIVGSICIGMNPAITENIGSHYINSKIFGGFSLQIGWDELEQSEIDSNMRAQIFMVNKTISVDEKVLFENGKLMNIKR